ncbi:hypothetical protein ANCCEY_09113 [Ancylostoma ceylanicum]|uniref:SXP/RAL-2 family protein Ani s 5-like cation-binding domain-containing protein n=1 Tax=Ancylostoma ceylanicum TaxID=53326 RepID=A0A0D6LII1_9BILA|nr:hypothetical protein ANCCEY_09113 [Ancylostoma ceylanicum]
MVSKKENEKKLKGPPPPPCGLPPFIDKVPADVQKKLQDIWKNYKQGDKCYNERGETRELLNSLPVEVRKVVYRHTTLPIPLTKAPKDVQERFRAILEDSAVPCGSKTKKMHELAQKVLVLNGDTLDEFNDYHSKVEENTKHIQEMVQRLSPEAKKALDEIFDLHAQEYRLMRNLSETVQNELLDIWKKERDTLPRQVALAWPRASQWL